MNGVSVRPPSGAARLLAAADPGLAAHTACFGPLRTPGIREFTAMLAEVGVRGRGGAGFPAARKLAAVAGQRRVVVVANGAEGEPDSAKDAVLLTRAPHLVLDGLAVLAAAVGADECRLYAAQAQLDVVRRALAERRFSGYDPTRVALTAAVDSFLAGEKSAVLQALAGRPAVPVDRPGGAARSGVRGRAALVHNVETLAQSALLARFGPGWFRTAGSAGEPGTMLVTLTGTARAGVVEVPVGIPLSALIADFGRTDPAGVRAVLVGGYHGTWIPGAALPAARMSHAGLRPLAAAPGAGVIRVLRRGECGLRVTAGLAGFLAEQSAGQCGPCRSGLPALSSAVTATASGVPGAAAESMRLTRLIDGRGACRHPDGTVRLVRSALTVFAGEVAAHHEGRCVAIGSRRTAAAGQESRHPEEVR